MSIDTLHLACPACGAAGMAVFYEVRAVPVNSVLLVTSRDEAMNFQTGDIALAACPACGNGSGWWITGWGSCGRCPTCSFTRKAR